MGRDIHIEKVGYLSNDLLHWQLAILLIAQLLLLRVNCIVIIIVVFSKLLLHFHEATKLFLSLCVCEGFAQFFSFFYFFFSFFTIIKRTFHRFASHDTIRSSAVSFSFVTLYSISSIITVYYIPHIV